MEKPTSAQMIAASEFLETEVRRKESMLAAASVLREAGVMQSQIEEGERTLRDVQAKIKIAQDDLATATGSVENAHTEAVVMMRNAREEATTIVRNATERADEMVAGANVRAVAIMAQAKADAEVVRRTSETMQASAQQAVTASKESLADDAKERDALRKELDDLERRLKEAKAEAQRLLRA